MRRRPVRVLQPMPPELLQAIGRVMVSWSSLEVFIDIAIARILNKAHQGAHAAITVGLRLPSKIDMLEGLAETGVAYGPAYDDIMEIIAEIRRAQTDRNFIAHAQWNPMKETDETVYCYITKKNTEGGRSENYGATDVQKIADRIKAVESHLVAWAFQARLRRAARPWHERLKPPPPQSRGAAPRGPKHAKRQRPPQS